MNQNKLLQITKPIFDLAITIINNQEIEQDFRLSIIAEIEKIERQALENNINMQTFFDIKYALTAFIDEIVLKSTLSCKMAWLTQPLQLKFFGEHLAGLQFFRRLEELRENPQQNIDLIEIYYYCMHLGFEGMYRLKPSNNHKSLLTSIQNQIEEVRGKLNTSTITTKPANAEPAKTTKSKLSLRIISVMTTVIVMAIYLGFAWTINHRVQTLINQLQQLHIGPST